MKVQGIAGARHPSLKKGDVIELSPEDKVCASAREQVTENSPDGYKHIPISAEVFGKVQMIAGRKVKNNPDPAQYIGTVIVKYRALRLADDRLTQAKSIKVKVHCKDCLDDIGVCDLETVDYKVLKEL